MNDGGKSLAAISTGLDGIFALDDNGDVHSCVASIADELKSRGIIYEHTDGFWHIRSTDPLLLQHEFEWLEICDFCDQRPVTWHADVADFRFPDKSQSRGGWAACEACGQAIADGKRKELLRLALAASDRRRPTLATYFNDSLAPRRIIEAYITDVHARFWRHFRSIERVIPKTFGH